MRNFEDIMKEKLYGAESDYSEKLWGNIKKQIPIAKKSNARYYWMASFLVAFTSMIFMVQQYPNWKVKQQANQVTEVEALDVSKFILSPEDLASRQIYSTSHLKPTLKSPIAFDDKVLSTQAKVLDSDVPTLSSVVSNELISADVAFTNQTSLESIVLRDDFFSEKSKNTESENLEVASKAPLYTLAKISKFNVGLKIPTYEVPEKNKIKDNDVHCEVLNGRQSKYYIAARHINSYAFNSISAKNPAAEEYMSSRFTSESKKYSFSDEVALGMEYRSGLFVELGFRYDQINEKFNYLDPNARGETTVIVSDSVFSGGVSEVFTDTITTELSGVREIVNNNHFRKISVPLSVGYEFPLNKKVSIAGRTGLVLNIWSKYEGKMFDENLEVVSINDRQSSNNPFFNKLVHSVSASAYLQYQMNKRMEFLVGLDGYKNLGSASFDSNPLNQKHSSLGIFVGTKYNL